MVRCSFLVLVCFFLPLLLLAAPISHWTDAPSVASNKSSWGDFSRAIFGRGHSPDLCGAGHPESANSYDYPAPSLPALDFGLQFDGGDIAKRDGAGGHNAKKRSLWSDLVLGYHLFRSSSPSLDSTPSSGSGASTPPEFHGPVASLPRPVVVVASGSSKVDGPAPTLPALDLGPAFDAGDIAANYQQYANPWAYDPAAPFAGFGGRVSGVAPGSQG